MRKRFVLHGICHSNKEEPYSYSKEDGRGDFPGKMQTQKNAEHRAIWEREYQRRAERAAEWAYDAWLKGHEERTATVNAILALRDTVAASAIDVAARAESHACYESVLADARREVELWDARHPEAVKRHTEGMPLLGKLPRPPRGTPLEALCRSAEDALRNAG
jgi:hypothetical protein